MDLSVILMPLDSSGIAAPRGALVHTGFLTGLVPHDPLMMADESFHPFPWVKVELRCSSSSERDPTAARDISL